MAKLLKKKRDERFQTAEEVAELLGNWQAHLQKPDDVDLPQATPRSGNRLPPIAKWATGIGFGGLLIWLAAIIILETGKGTLLIESNNDTDIPIRIMQGNESVEHLTITKAGAKTRLKAGEYVIEIDDPKTTFSITDEQVELQRGGTWIARIKSSTHDAWFESRYNSFPNANRQGKPSVSGLGEGQHGPAESLVCRNAEA